MASERKKNATNDKNDTDQLLASLGSTVANVDTYESSVLRQATLDSAPLLTGVGFPDLSPLAPSYDARRGQLAGSADAQHALTLLSRVRSELQQQQEESHHVLVLRMKEQLLLTYLQTVAGLSPDDLPVDPLREAAMEQKRSLQLTAPKKKRATTTIGLRKSDGTMARSVASASATASFGKQALREKEARSVKRRTPMMRLKQSQQQEPNEEDQERKQMLKQQRRERQERRKRRQEQWQYESSEEEEMNFDDDEQVVPPPAMEQQAEASNVSNGEPATALATVSCPLCEQPVETGGDVTQEESDAKLSQHMQDCQGRRSRRRSRGSTNVSTAPTLPPPVKATAAKKKKRSSSKKRKQPTQSSWKEAVDDFDEWDYEDRVDDWIAHGIDRMREIAERDEMETPPGTVAYPEDLVIPGWVNNRLFPYQRTGLRWMWDLHLQEAGGVVGDEMGLGKTVQGEKQNT